MKIIELSDFFQTKPVKAAAKRPPLAALISPALRAEAAAATVHGSPLFPSLRRNAAKRVSRLTAV